MANAGRAFHLEPGGIDQPAYPTGAGEGADGRARCGQAREFGEQLGGPHVRVFRRGKAVEKPRIYLRVQLRQLLQGVADQQGQGDATGVQHQALKALMDSDVLGQQLFGVRLQLGPEGEGALQVGMAERVFFHADEMQACPGHRLLVE
ncbi:hypothetical protein [Pseudomonas sp. 31 R 17]|nr:hypothetical protein [Pseudomonas sp. 31 R 17]